MAAYRRVYDSRHLHAAKNRDQLRDPTLGNGVSATLTFLLCTKILILYNIEWRELSDIAQVRGHILSRLRWLSNATRIKWQQDNKAIAWMPSEKISPGTRKTWRSIGVQLQTTGGSWNSAGKTWRQQLKTGKEMACDGCGINRDLGQS